MKLLEIAALAHELRHKCKRNYLVIMMNVKDLGAKKKQ